MKEKVKITILKSLTVVSPFSKGRCKQYDLQLNYKNQSYNFTFWDSVHAFENKQFLNTNDALYSLLMDASCYNQSSSEEDFLNEFGYNNEDIYTYYKQGLSRYQMEDCFSKDSINKLKDGLKAYAGCRKTALALSEMFTEEELDQLNEEFQDY